MKSIFISFVLFFATGISLFAQDQDAATLHETAKKYMREGDYTNAIVVLNNAIKKDAVDIELQKDLAFSYYLNKDYDKAKATARPLIDRPDADVQSFQILAMVLKIDNDAKACEKLYKIGLKKFPTSGPLYNEYGEVMGTQNGTTAIELWEKGIEVDPGYAMNYYNACKYYYAKKEKVWCILYGEIFLNLDSYSKRTAEIKDFIEDEYKKVFAEADAMKKEKSKNIFTDAFLTALYDQSSAVSGGVNAQSLSILRTRFILEWFDKYAVKFPFRLFDYQHQLVKEGMFDAYNQWIFGDVESPEYFKIWVNTHKDEYEKFINFQKGRVFKIPTGQYYRSAK
jgi:tetratricopeptide (TPR) repeat protein